MSDTYRVVIREDGVTVQEFVGIDWENGSTPITVWHETKTHVVFKHPSGYHWESILHPRVSHPGHYQVCEIEADETAPDKLWRTLRVRELFTMPVSSRGRAMRSGV